MRSGSVVCGVEKQVAHGPSGPHLPHLPHLPWGVSGAPTKLIGWRAGDAPSDFRTCVEMTIYFLLEKLELGLETCWVRPIDGDDDR